jgi:hypothetical protein
VSVTKANRACEEWVRYGMRYARRCPDMLGFPGFERAYVRLVRADYSLHHARWVATKRKREMGMSVTAGH